MWFSALYELGVILLFFAALPKALYECIRYGKHKTNFIKRFGVGFPAVTRKNNGPIIWVHAVSVGECHAANPLIKRLQAEIPNATIVISSVSETGHAEAKKTITTADHHVYLPFDFYFCVKSVLKKCQPDLVILCEGDFWYRFLKESKRHGAVTVVVNGKLSSSSERTFAHFKGLTARLFALVDFLCVQSDLYKARFLHIGVPASKIAITGNLKVDSLPTPIPDDDVLELRTRLHLSPGDKVLVVGSTHEPEEDLILSQLTPVIAKFPQLKIVIAPRHPERFEQVAALIQKFGLSYGTWTKGTQNPHPQVYLIDAMGVLRKCYQLADIALVAGSFTDKVGGHNIMEPQAFGIPVICGPHMHSQPQLIECANYYKAILQVQPNEIGSSVEQLLTDPTLSINLGKCALTMVAALKGATNRTRDELYLLAPQFFRL
ncbi:MAG: 3-deoxy-D-manno-octulosonic acid transferase [Chlamydiales bacterium]|nr:3-deoxy-D-manno-octulosonic acid transferase [Chlamydiales bacterium]